MALLRRSWGLVMEERGVRDVRETGRESICMLKSRTLGSMFLSEDEREVWVVVVVGKSWVLIYRQVK
jgi:hypothetical protein